MIARPSPAVTSVLAPAFRLGGEHARLLDNQPGRTTAPVTPPEPPSPRPS